MSKLKKFLPAFKYLKGKFASRGQFLLPNGQPYEGAYHQLYNGETYTGSVPSKDAIRIFKDDSEPHLPLPEYADKLVSEPVYPQPEDYDKGYFLRYFIKDTRNGKIIEVKKETSRKKLEQKYLKGITVKWILEKPVRDIFNQGYLYKGAATRNKENTQKANLELKGLDLFVTEFDKYVNIESDVEGYKFEDLSREEKLKIIKRTSNIQKNKPELKLKSRFGKLLYPHIMYNPKTGLSIKVKNRKEHEKYAALGWVHQKLKPIERPRTLSAPTLSTAPRTAGGGGRGGGGLGYSNNDEGIFDEGNIGNEYGGGGNIGGSSTINQY